MDQPPVLSKKAAGKRRMIDAPVDAPPTSAKPTGERPLLHSARAAAPRVPDTSYDEQLARQLQDKEREDLKKHEEPEFDELDGRLFEDDDDDDEIEGSRYDASRYSPVNTVLPRKKRVIKIEDEDEDEAEADVAGYAWDFDGEEWKRMRVNDVIHQFCEQVQEEEDGGETVDISLLAMLSPLDGTGMNPIIPKILMDGD